MKISNDTKLWLVVFIGILAFITFMATSAEAQEMFYPFDGSKVEERHRPAGYATAGMSMLYYEVGIMPEIAVPLGIGTTLIAEHIAHKGSHGITKGEVVNVLAWGGVTYLGQKVLDHYGVPTLFTMRWDEKGLSISKTWEW